MLWSIGLMLACSGASPDPAEVAEGEAVAATTAAEPAVPAEPSAAPSREWMGLTLGQSTAAELDAWVLAKGLRCSLSSKPKDDSHEIRCDKDLPKDLLPNRSLRGKLADLMVVRSGEGPIHLMSISRHYTEAAEVAEDYNSSLTALTAQLGSPTRSQPIDLPKLATPIARFASSWEFTDLKVTLTVLKMGGSSVAVNERWDVPGMGDGPRRQATTYK